MSDGVSRSVQCGAIIIAVLALWTPRAWAPPPMPAEHDISKEYVRCGNVFLAQAVDGVVQEEGRGIVRMNVIHSWKGNLKGLQEINWDFGYRYYGGGVPFEPGHAYAIMEYNDPYRQIINYMTRELSDDFVETYCPKRNGVCVPNRAELDRMIGLDGTMVPYIYFELFPSASVFSSPATLGRK